MQARRTKKRWKEKNEKKKEEKIEFLKKRVAIKEDLSLKIEKDDHQLGSLS